ncbi:TIGR02217 family protein [Hyphomonas sp.]|uniref:phage distal tail protein, Rcc01695 family n=1 Tax=Hyphomonas sp. TaxID=87 RepID=UPI00391CAAF8
MSLAQFHEVSLPVPLALAASGGPERKVQIVQLANGREVRNAVWAGSRRSWDIGTAASRLETLQALIAFFEARGGRLHGFRFRDFLDDRSGSPGADVSPVDQFLGTGDGTQTRFHVVKHYDGWARRIWKPVAGTVRAAVDGDEVAFSANHVEGTIDFLVPPPDGASVTAGFRFDCPVRFDADRLDINLEGFGAGRAIRVPLIEILE